MKKMLLLSALGALTLASCSQDEPVMTGNGISSDYTIGFRPAMGSAVSPLARSTEITNANLSEINVTAFMGDQLFFPGLDFTKGTDGLFVSTPEYHWPGDDTELTFYSYAPSNPGATVTIDKNTKNMTGFSPAANVADQVDFITATASGNRSQNEVSGVELTFGHRLSQIEVRAKADNEVYTFKISGVRIGEPVSEGSFDFTTTDWTLGSDKAIYEETYDTPVTLTANEVSIMGSEGNAMLLPQQLTAWDPTTDASNSAQGAYLSVRLQIQTTQTGVTVYPFPSEPGCQWAAIPISTNWEQGKKYIYTLDLSHGAGNVDPHDPDPGVPVLGGPIKFTVNVQDWVDNPIDLPMDVTQQSDDTSK